MSEKLYPLAVEIADHLTMLNGRNWTVTETPPGRDWEPQDGRAYITSDDGYMFHLRSNDPNHYRSERDRLHLSPESPRHADGSYPRSNRAENMPSGSVSNMRKPAMIAKDLHRRIIVPGLVWVDKTRELIRIADEQNARKEAIKQDFVNTFR